MTLSIFAFPTMVYLPSKASIKIWLGFSFDILLPYIKRHNIAVPPHEKDVNSGA